MPEGWVQEGKEVGRHSRQREKSEPENILCVWAMTGSSMWQKQRILGKSGGNVAWIDELSESGVWTSFSISENSGKI